MENLHDYTKRKFIIFNTSELYKINFDEVCESSDLTIRKSLDGAKTFIKWDSLEMPTCISSLLYKEGPYSYSEILNILSTSEWTNK